MCLLSLLEDAKANAKEQQTFLMLIYFFLLLMYICIKYIMVTINTDIDHCKKKKKKN